MKIGRRKHIIPLIVRGVPRSKDPNAECFVPAILELTRELEPLEIDLKTYGERDSFLRGIATTLELDLEYFISIEDRERKRRAVIYSSAAAGFVITLGIAIWYIIASSNRRHNDSFAQLMNAIEYYDKQDYVQAVEWFEKSAANGNAAAQNFLGDMYYYGQGVEQDYSKALEWYKKAVNNALVDALNNLGIMYENGLGVEQDYAKAKECYEKAANHGVARAQYHLGEMYYYRRGVGRDYTKAKEWYEEAAANGDEDAKKKLAEITGKLASQDNQ